MSTEAEPDRPNAGDVYRALAPAVLGYLRSQRVREPEDALGEVFVQVARDLKRGRFAGDAAALRRWVFSIAHNRAMDAHRKAARDRTEPRDSLGEEPVQRPDHDERLVDPELVVALDRLSPEQREVLLLRFVGDLSLEDCARITGRKVGAVKAMQHRGLEALRRSLGEPYPHG